MNFSCLNAWSSGKDLQCLSKSSRKYCCFLWYPRALFQPKRGATDVQACQSGNGSGPCHGPGKHGWSRKCTASVHGCQRSVFCWWRCTVRVFSTRCGNIDIGGSLMLTGLLLMCSSCVIAWQVILSLLARRRGWSYTSLDQALLMRLKHGLVTNWCSDSMPLSCSAHRIAECMLKSL